jgi:hypothetical protein
MASTSNNCCIPENQHIYQYLVDKANEFPDEPRFALLKKAYLQRAEEIKNLKTSVKDKYLDSPPPAFGDSAVVEPLKKRTVIAAPSIAAPPAPSPKQILREAMLRMNQEHPEENFRNYLHPLQYGTPYPGYKDEDFEEDAPLDEEELDEEELEELDENDKYYKWANGLLTDEELKELEELEESEEDEEDDEYCQWEKNLSEEDRERITDRYRDAMVDSRW